ncbi:penicillin-binding protein 1A [Solimonas terrae]|uniref:Penicillin-binding protein 1A n=1 Tax=Solimonas terrae TaxID=1396819 RepID=A0A6M2BV97_9GAMM|nr:penicillin-binding protein 1A [Solimonas terrae]NGY06496.1 penicillin-binding protein 1A [Solimonas terrae]
MKRWILISTLGVAVLLCLGAAAVWAGALYLGRDLPPVDSIRQLQLSVPLRVLSQDGKLIGQFGAERRSLLRYDDIPPNVIHAFLAAEDDRFFEHPGVDWQGLVRASFVLAVSGEKSQGGSTITMQLARNVFLSNERTFTRKFKEILLALRIEHELSKKEILELYLNKIFLGERAYGVGAASRVYFGKDIHQLSLGEIAVIAGLPKAPSRDNPVANPQRAKERRDYVLSRMHSLGEISDTEYQAARAEPVVVHPYQAKLDVDAQYVAEMARAWAVEHYGDDAYTRGLTVITTLDSGRQLAANAALRRALLDYDERHGWRGPEAQLPLRMLSDQGHDELAQALDARPPVADLRAAVVVSFAADRLQLITEDGPMNLDKDAFSWANLTRKPLQPGDVVRIRPVGARWRLAEIPAVQGAFVALRPDDGAIQALVGGFDFYANKFNRVTQARRQSGSGFKPFLYAAGLAQGLTPASVFLDAPVVVDDPSADNAWRPENFEGDLKGPMSLREALVHSRNLVSIRLLQAIGIDYTRQYVPRFGLPGDRLPDNLTMALGTAVFTPLEMARGYATIANGGFVIDPYLVSEVRDADGQVLYKAAPKHACPDCPDTAPQQSPGDSATAAGADATTDDSVAPRTIEPQVDWLISDMMHDVATRGTGAKTNELHRNDLAGKTGTTNDETDAWFNGFQKTQVAIAWVGFDQPAPLGPGEVGARAALPIWIDYMRAALKGVPEERLPRPDGLVDVRIDPRTGKLAPADAPDAVFEVVQQDHIPEAEAADAHNDPNKANLEDLY